MKKPDFTDIPVGRANAISGCDLATLWGTDQRGVRAIVSALRQADSDEPYVLCSSTVGIAGYWLSDNPFDIMEFIGHVSRRATHTFLPIARARKVLKLLEGGGADAK